MPRQPGCGVWAAEVADDLKAAVRRYLTAKRDLREVVSDWRDNEAARLRAEMENAEAEMALLAMR